MQPRMAAPEGGIPEKVRLRLDRLLHVNEGLTVSGRQAPDDSGGPANRANPARPRCHHRDRIQRASSPGNRVDADSRSKRLRLVPGESCRMSRHLR